jgi:polyisoprenoid-binding protein YceI
MKLFARLGFAALFVSAFAMFQPAFAADEPDSIVVLAKHAPDPKPDDPVQVKFEKFKVVKASFDAKKIEGAKATIEIDPASLKSGSDKRDAHLNSPDLLDSKKFPKITVDIDKVKKKTGNTYAAEATVKYRDITKKYPVTFDVVDAKDDALKIKGETAFSRYDFNVGGKDLSKLPVSPDLTIKLNLTLKKS